MNAEEEAKEAKASEMKDGRKRQSVGEPSSSAGARKGKGGEG